MLVWLVISWGICMGAQAGEFRHVQYEKALARKPDTEGKGVRVWNVRQDAVIRVNLVEMSGELPLHRHPDAEHSLMVLEGRVRVQVGERMLELGKGDYVSVPAGVPHKYWTLGGKAMLVSMDAPYYDPKKTVRME
jgi:quercetin dioxygenase-like cupin family protein